MSATPLEPEFVAELRAVVFFPLIFLVENQLLTTPLKPEIVAELRAVVPFLTNFGQCQYFRQRTDTRV